MVALMLADRPRVGLFVTCLVDLFRPVGRLRRGEAAGGRRLHVEVPRAQTCCGQPAYNSGDRADAPSIAEEHDRGASSGFDYVVAPSGSCAGMIEEALSGAVRRRPALGAARRASWPSGRYELITFLTDVRGMTRRRRQRCRRRVTYHDSCSGLRELGVKQQPRRLLASVDGLELRRAAGRRGLLRLRRHVLRQVSGHLQHAWSTTRPTDIAATGAEHAARRRSRLPDEHGRQAEAAAAERSRCATSPRCWPA